MIQVEYAGKLLLKSPIIVASSGLTNNFSQIKNFAEAGVGAVVLKSIFEEQLEGEVAYMADGTDFPEALEYLGHYVQSHALEHHINLLKRCKKELPSLPVIASVNCYKSTSWVNYAETLVEAGADALELNVMRLESDRTQEWGAGEKELVCLVRSLRERLGEDYPLTIKIPKYYTNVVRLCHDLKLVGADGVVLFNRGYTPDVDIDKEELIGGSIFSSPSDYGDALRWCGLLRGALPDWSISLSGGARDGADLIKGVLVGADAVQYCSALYQDGATVVRNALEFLEEWMEKHQYHQLTELRGRLAATRVDRVSWYQRTQFMKYFSTYDERPADCFGGSRYKEEGEAY